MPLPDLSTVCIDLKVTSQELCVTFPGGAEMCVQIPGVPDPTDVSKQLLAQANAALAPLVPVFNIVDAIIALFNCVKAIPDSLGPPPDPTKLAECIPDLAEKIDKLLKLIPQLSIPVLIAGLIDVLLFYLQGFRGQLEAIIAHQARLLAAATRAAELGNVQLRTVVDCANATMDAYLQNLNEGMKPLNRLVALLNLFLQLAGLSPIPDFKNLGDDAEAALAPLDAVIDSLKTIRAGLPG
jgi:hypothetical protein